MNERIRELIKALNMKQAEFAKRIGVSRPFVSELCSGNKKPSDRTVADICREFNVNEQWLRTGEGDMFLCIELVAKYACRIGGVRWIRETIWLDEKNKKTAKQVAAVLAEAKATCSDVRAILQAVWDYLGVTVCEDGDA